MATTTNLRWFEAEFTGGVCGACREHIKRGMRIAYRGTGSTRIMVGYECCQGEGTDTEPYILPDGEESMSVSDEEGALQVTNPTAYMPPGRTKNDYCTKCFVIHTQAQGEECW